MSKVSNFITSLRDIENQPKTFYGDGIPVFSSQVPPAYNAGGGTNGFVVSPSQQSLTPNYTYRQVIPGIGITDLAPNLFRFMRVTIYALRQFPGPEILGPFYVGKMAGATNYDGNQAQITHNNGQTTYDWPTPGSGGGFVSDWIDITSWNFGTNDAIGFSWYHTGSEIIPGYANYSVTGTQLYRTSSPQDVPGVTSAAFNQANGGRTVHMLQRIEFRDYDIQAGNSPTGAKINDYYIDNLGGDRYELTGSQTWTKRTFIATESDLASVDLADATSYTDRQLAAFTALPAGTAKDIVTHDGNDWIATDEIDVNKFSKGGREISGVVIDSTAPTDISLLWLDTSN